MCNGSAIIRDVEDIVDRDRVAVLRERIESGELADTDGDLGQLLGRRPELVHVTTGRHGVAPASTLPQEHSNRMGRRTLDRVAPDENVLVPSIRPIRDNMSDP